MRQRRDWTPQPAGDLPDGVILFDGDCVLCSRWARFTAARDRDARFRFAPLRSDYGRALAARFDIDPDDPETNVVIADGQAWFKSDAALGVLQRLPGWRWTRAGAALPRPVRNWLYDRVARNRYALFGRREQCWLDRPELETRVLKDAP